MKQNERKIVTKKSLDRRRYFIIFASFTAALLVVVAIFQLVINKKRADWLAGDLGTSRDQMFPLVFETGRGLFFAENETDVRQIDDAAVQPVYDASLGRVYYIFPDSPALYEYNANSNTRVKLCENVAEYFLFKERTMIPFVDNGGSLRIYDYNKKTTALIAENALVLAVGKSFLAYGMPADDADILYLLNYNGESVEIGSFDSALPVYIWQEDRAVSYYNENGLNVTAVNNMRKGTGACFGEAEVIINRAVYEGNGECTAETFDGCVAVSHILTSGGELIYVKTGLSGSIKTESVSENVTEVLGANPDSGIAVYIKAGIIHYCVKAKESALFEAAPEAEYNFVPANNCLYMLEEDGTLSAVIINSGNATKTVLDYNCGSVRLSPGKSLVFAESADGKTVKTFLKTVQTDYFPADEVHCYGKSDSNYIMLRNGSVDLAESGEYRRVASDCELVAFEKNLNRILYRKDGKLYLYSEGNVTELYNAEDYAVAVKIVTEE